MSELLQFPMAGPRPRRPQGDIDVVIHQDELEALKLKRKRWGELTRELKSDSDSILWRLLEGFPVEAGGRIAEVVRVPFSQYKVERPGYYWVRVR